MRRQLKLQGQLAGPYVNRDSDDTAEKACGGLRQRSEGSDGELCDRRPEGEGSYPWTQNSTASALSVTPRSGTWERPEGPSSEELRSSSIAALRAKAREHEAEIHSTVKMSVGDAQTQEAAAVPSDWSASFFLFVQIILKNYQKREKKTVYTLLRLRAFLFSQHYLNTPSSAECKLCSINLSNLTNYHLITALLYLFW